MGRGMWPLPGTRVCNHQLCWKTRMKCVLQHSWSLYTLAPSNLAPCTTDLAFLLQANYTETSTPTPPSPTHPPTVTPIICLADTRVYRDSLHPPAF
jgi:hypothetical protein